jgi:protein TonB
MIRFLLALPLALLVTAALFTLMAWLVDNGHSGQAAQSNAPAFDIVMIEQERDVARRQRVLPEQPKAAPPTVDQLPVNRSQVNTVTLPDMPILGLDTANIGLDIGMPALGDFSANQQAMPLYRVEPRYPPRAIKQGAQGYVELSFTINTAGRPTNIKVLSAKPRHLFEKTAVKALRKWKYQPTLVDGKAVAQVGQTVTLEFKLSR